MTGPADGYTAAGEAMDEHLRTCRVCAAGGACGDGDDAAENEFRAWRRWERDDPDGAATYRRQATTSDRFDRSR